MWKADLEMERCVPAMFETLIVARELYVKNSFFMFFLMILI